MAEDRLRQRLDDLHQKTKSSEDLLPSSYWVGDTAGARRVFDDRDAGRLNWTASHKFARDGIKALDAGDRELAEFYSWAATDAYIAALEARVRPSELDALNKPSQRRGRPRKK